VVHLKNAKKEGHFLEKTHPRGAVCRTPRNKNSADNQQKEKKIWSV
jgi:hypothetical protein